MSDQEYLTATSSEAVALLRRHRELGGDPRPEIDAGLLPEAELKVLPGLFQPRELGEHVVNRSHVADLQKVLGRRKRRGLDPIVVFWSGLNWFVVDGHHRLAAYRSSEGWAGRTVSVERFEGTVEDAIAEAAQLNSKTVMSLLKIEKSQIGWKLVCLGDHKVTDVMAAADLSNGTVKKMRSRMREVLAAYPGRYTRESLSSCAWREVIKPDFGGPVVDKEIDDEWEAKLAREFKDRLRKEFGDKLEKCPNSFAMAIRLLHNGLPAMLMESLEWEDQRDALLDSWVADREDRPNYDFS